MGKLFSTVAGGAFDFLGKFKVYLVAGAVVFASCVGCFEAGIMKGHEEAALSQATQTKVEANADVAAAVNAGNQKVAAVVISHNKDQDEDLARDLRDAKRVTKLAQVTTNLTEDQIKLTEVNSHEADYPGSCNLRTGDLSLLDYAAAGPLVSANGSGRTQELPTTASVSSDAGQTPSAIGERAFVGDELSVRTQYRELAAEHDALIDWVQRELVKPMQDQAAADQPAPPAASK